MYGGDGTATFALHDLRGRIPICCHDTYLQGEAGGKETHALLPNEMPQHTHDVHASSNPVDTPLPSHATWGDFPDGYTASAKPLLHAAAISEAGGGQEHNNMQPYICRCNS